MPLTPSTFRIDSGGRGKKCGSSHIPQSHTCHAGSGGGAPRKKPPSALTAGAVGLGVGVAALGAGMLAMNRAGRSRRTSSGSEGGGNPPRSSALSNPRAPRPSGGPITPVHVRVEQPQLTGTSPRGLLSPAPPRQSKTQRMRANTAAAVRQAEGRVAQTAQQEVRRIAQIGNTMASVGEATGMAAKTAFREVRLRTEAARRRFEPGYRAPDQRRLTPGTQAQLPESGLTPERLPLPIDPRTGQPRRRRARGFGRRDSDMQFLHTQYIDPAVAR